MFTYTGNRSFCCSRPIRKALSYQMPMPLRVFAVLGPERLFLASRFLDCATVTLLACAAEKLEDGMLLHQQVEGH